MKSFCKRLSQTPYEPMLARLGVRGQGLEGTVNVAREAVENAGKAELGGGPERQVLQWLDRGEPLTIRELHRKTAIAHQRLVQICESLVKAGAVEPLTSARTIRYQVVSR